MIVGSWVPGGSCLLRQLNRLIDALITEQYEFDARKDDVIGLPRAPTGAYGDSFDA